MIKHQYIKITDIDKGFNSEKRLGVMVGCPECGEVRNLWETGQIDFVVKGAEKLHDTNRPNN